MNRAINVARLQMANKWTFIGIPLVILAGAFALTMGIFAFIPGGEDKISGAAQAPLWYFFAIGLQSLTLTFPFSQGLSISRRTYYTGTVGLVVVFSLVWALLYYVLGKIEIATNGWWVNGHMFWLPWVSSGPWYQTISFYWACVMFLFFIGLWGATIWKRWAMNGILVAVLGTAAVLLAGAATVNFTDNWPSVGHWFTVQTALTMGGYIAILVAILGVGSFLTLRRATP